MDLDKELKSLLEKKHESWGKLMHLLKRSFDEWANMSLARKGYVHFKIGYMPFLMNIGVEGTTNTELAQKAKVTKQAMSKVVKELEEAGYIKSVINKNDRRSVMLELTDKGKKLVIEVRKCLDELLDEYKKLVGVERLKITMDVLWEIIEYHKENNPDS